ncbi:MAG: ABC transporter permease [Pirellulales bacterium]|nr:ABC transporter permease [Pirellulales bacterium]
MWSIALRTLIADRGKLLTALVGVIFSVVLVNVQGGLFFGLIRKASLLVEHGEADVWVGHRNMHNVDFPRDVPRRWIHRVRAVPGVRRAEAYLVGFADMTLPSGGFEGVVVVGVDRASLLGGAWNVAQGRPEDVLENDAIVLDECENEKLEYPRIGDVRELNHRRARVVAKTNGVMGFLVAPYVFTTYERAGQYLRMPPDRSSYFLVQLEPGADAEAVCADIRRQIPELDAFPKREYGWISVSFWMTRTGLGISFGAATLLGLLVGMIMVAQTLYALVLDRLGEFGTLKAMGARERHVYTILLVQASIMALAGSIAGLALVSGIQRFYSTPQAPIVVPWWLSAGSCLLVLVICLVSSLLPYQRVRKLDPMMVLQS